uniref:Uncharacterized protein n=1 Tax=Anguilla anguilla TaxID=7936 RepID=A0A0E9VVH7_ANGAN
MGFGRCSRLYILHRQCAWVSLHESPHSAQAWAGGYCKNKRPALSSDNRHFPTLQRRVRNQ